MDANLLVGWQVDLRFMKYLNNAIEIYTNKWNFIEKFSLNLPVQVY